MSCDCMETLNTSDFDILVQISDPPYDPTARFHCLDFGVPPKIVNRVLFNSPSTYLHENFY